MTGRFQRDDKTSEAIRIAEQLLAGGEHGAAVSHCTALRYRAGRAA